MYATKESVDRVETRLNMRLRTVQEHLDAVGGTVVALLGANSGWSPRSRR
jgi:hypothetical protein